MESRYNTRSVSGLPGHGMQQKALCKETVMTQNEQYLNLLSTFHYIMGGLTALFSCFPLIHVAIGIAMLLGAFDGPNQPPQALAWLFILVPAFFILIGLTMAILMIMAGHRLKARTSRTFCLVIAAMECTMVPLGTVLGVFTLIVLTKEPVKDLFAASNADTRHASRRGITTHAF